MVKYSKEFKEQALLLSNEQLGVKKAAEQLGINYYTIAEWRKTRRKEERITSDKTPLNERELAIREYVPTSIK